jgi:hypothetical protein
MKRLETMKHEKYKTIYARAGVDYMPLAVVMHGAVSDTFLKQIASDAADHIGTPYCSIFYSCWPHRVSTTLQKTNANVLLLANNMGLACVCRLSWCYERGEELPSWELLHVNITYSFIALIHNYIFILYTS